MDHDVGGGELTAEFTDQGGEKVPLGGRHRPLDQVIFGIDLVAHDETRVYEDVRFAQQGFESCQLFDPAGGEKELGREGPPGIVLDIAGEEGVRFK